MPFAIDTILPQLREHLAAAPNVVLTAPPGSGKTTRIPLALLEEPWLHGRKILLLEPRRLAARAAARWMAAGAGDAVGGTVGYRVRLDTQVGPRTRIEVVTEGILPRLLQDDPALEAYGLIVFDEFHERSLHADVGLALALETQRLFRPDLRLLVMSATLETGPVAALLGNAPTVRLQGRQFPVEVRYRRTPVVPWGGPAHLDAVVETVRQLLATETGGLLVFLPGMAEIRQVERRLRAHPLPANVRVTPLHGDLPAQEQEHAIQPAPAGSRKIVLSSAVAESSVTIEDIRVVVDAGLMRVPRFDPRTGLTRLQTVRVTQDSAEQRRGRAGRVQPGVCVRLWTAAEQAALVPRRSPEMLEADLAPVLLELAAWGAPDPSSLSWLDPPPAAALAAARDLLTRLCALDPSGRITPYGRRLVRLGLHPRLGHMVLRAEELDRLPLACDLAALLTERDVCPPGASADLRLRLDRLASGSGADDGLPPPALKRIRQLSRQIQHLLPQTPGMPERVGSAATARRDRDDASGEVRSEAGTLLAFAYPDRIAQRQREGRYRLANGRGAVLPGADPLAVSDYLVIADLDDTGEWSRIFLAAPVSLEDLERHHPDLLERHDVTEWDERLGALRARRELRLGALVVRAQTLASPPPDQARAAVLARLRQDGLDLLPWTEALRQWQARVQFLRGLGPHSAGRDPDDPWPDVSDEALLARLDEWLEPWLEGVTRLDHIRRIDLAGALQALLPWTKRQELDQLAPAALLVPSGSRIRLDYRADGRPVLAVRVQELFGCRETPRVAAGRIPVTLHLLSPAGRPVQVTQDLARFWVSGYPEVRRELRGRYAKHDWPEDPLHATPTRRPSGAARHK